MLKLTDLDLLILIAEFIDENDLSVEDFEEGAHKEALLCYLRSRIKHLSKYYVILEMLKTKIDGEVCLDIREKK